ncbi:PREDICTED: N-acetyltransferase 6 [Elephantulus edwardii]|uniref:N-acetyltransferase 6 n=1 Tax=Elephantulus edwardii TaxID=28737 RepID=UPI0003F07ED4|nr:PREDICTED: N-acetyltransferase 6 [Elephantulus edwardii]
MASVELKRGGTAAHGTGDDTCKLTLNPSLSKLTLTPDPAYWMELILGARPAELTLDSTHQPESHPEMTLSPGAADRIPDPVHQLEETPGPSLARLTLEPVHCRPELLDACADLINEQWPRSRASRLHSLGQSSDAFPLCLMLLSPGLTPKAAPIVVGHARLSRVLDRPESLLVETVVVARALRGRGFGRQLMEGLETFAKARGFSRLHLTTHDQMHFYAHLGYQLSEPVQGLVFTSRQLPATLLNAFPRTSYPPNPCKTPNLTAQAASSRVPRGPPLPPPPPLPEPQTILPPPPPPPPLPPGSSSPTLLETQYRDVKGCPIFWMEKDI